MIPKATRALGTAEWDLWGKKPVAQNPLYMKEAQPKYFDDIKEGQYEAERHRPQGKFYDDIKLGQYEAERPRPQGNFYDDKYDQIRKPRFYS